MHGCRPYSSICRSTNGEKNKSRTKCQRRHAYVYIRVRVLFVLSRLDFFRYRVRWRVYSTEPVLLYNITIQPRQTAFKAVRGIRSRPTHVVSSEKFDRRTIPGPDRTGVHRRSIASDVGRKITRYLYHSSSRVKHENKQSVNLDVLNVRTKYVTVVGQKKIRFGLHPIVRINSLIRCVEKMVITLVHGSKNARNSFFFLTSVGS